MKASALKTTSCPVWNVPLAVVRAGVCGGVVVEVDVVEVEFWMKTVVVLLEDVDVVVVAPGAVVVLLEVECVVVVVEGCGCLKIRISLAMLNHLTRGTASSAKAN
jgi:hypothetical protein